MSITGFLPRAEESAVSPADLLDKLEEIRQANVDNGVVITTETATINTNLGNLETRLDTANGHLSSLGTLANQAETDRQSILTETTAIKDALTGTGGLTDLLANIDASVIAKGDATIAAVNGVNTTLTATNASLANLETLATQAETDRQAILTEVQSLNTAQAATTAAIGTLETTLQGEIQTLNTSVANNGAKLDAIEADIEAGNVTLSAIDGKLAILDTSVNGLLKQTDAIYVTSQRTTELDVGGLVNDGASADYQEVTLTGSIISVTAGYHGGSAGNIWVKVNTESDYQEQLTQVFQWDSAKLDEFDLTQIDSITFLVEPGERFYLSAEGEVAPVASLNTSASDPRGGAVTLQYLTFGQSGEILSSADAVTWSSQTSGVSEVINDGIFDGSQWVMVGNAGTVLTSADGISYTAQTSGTARDLAGVHYDGAQYIAVGGDLAGFSNPVILTSPDAIVWNSQTVPGGVLNPVRAVGSGGGLYVAVGRAAILNSNDGVSWTLVYGGSTSDPIHDLVYTGTAFLAPTYSGIERSVNGSSWTLQGGLGGWNGVAFGAGVAVAVGDNGKIQTSADHGVTWVAQTSGVTATLLGVHYGGSQFVVSGASGVVLTSADGVSWTAQTSGTSARLEDVTSL